MHLQLFIQNNQKNQKLAAKDITLIAMMVAVIEVCKAALSFAPNVELTSFWVIMFTLYFGNHILYVIPVFILIEGAIYGFGLWWVMYLYAWPLLVFIVWYFRKTDSAVTWSIISGIFGLLFGALCAIPYLVTGGPYVAFTWWVGGIPWDFVHGIGNFVIMLILYHPVKKVMQKTRNMIL